MSLVIGGFDFLSLKGAYLISTIALVVFLYSYVFYLYSRQKRGIVDYEKYSNLALYDSLDDEILERMDEKIVDSKKLDSAKQERR